MFWKLRVVTVSMSIFLLHTACIPIPPCPIVNRGPADDGITTIRVLQPPSPCPASQASLFAGWQCLKVESSANNNGVVYQLDIRWNRVGKPVLGSFTWLKGGDSTDFHRETSKYASSIQDQLDRTNFVRSIEIKFLGGGGGGHDNGIFTMPRNGFPNISAVYADVLEYLVEQNIAIGITGHYGGSGGSMQAANALAYHRIETLLDGVVLAGGPFWTDLRAVCTDPNSPIFGSDALRRKVDDVNWPGSNYCYDQSPTSEPSYECRSTLGPEADLNYPNLRVSVIVGSLDDPWIDTSAATWLEAITALNKTFDRPVASHNILNSQDGANTALARIREIVAPDPPSGRYIDPIFEVTENDITRDVLYAPEKPGDPGIPNPLQNNRREYLHLDVCEPHGDTLAKRPVVLYFHGGSFTVGSKNDTDAQYFCKEYAERGYVGITADYRLGTLGSGGDAPPSPINSKMLVAKADMGAAVRYVRAHAAGANTFRFDSEKIIVAGFSAGSLTAINFAYTNNDLPLDNPTWPGYSNEVQGVFGLDGTPDGGAVEADSTAPGMIFLSENPPDVPPVSFQCHLPDSTEFFLVADAGPRLLGVLTNLGVRNDVACYHNTNHTGLVKQPTLGSILSESLLFHYDSIVP